jgi:hypothetical protein
MKMSIFDSIKYPVPADPVECWRFTLNLPDDVYRVWIYHPEFRSSGHRAFYVGQHNKKLLEKIIYNWEME